MTDRARHSYKGKKGGQARRGNAGANKQASSNAKQIYKKFKQTAESNRERGSYTSGNGNRTVSVRHKQGSQTNTTSGSSSTTRRPTSTADRMKQFSTGGSRRQVSAGARKVQRDFARSQSNIIKGAVESGIGGTMKGFGSLVESSKATGKSGTISHKLGGSASTRRNDRTKPGEKLPKRKANTNTVKQIQEQRRKAGENLSNKGDKLITKGTKRIEEEKKNMSGFGKWLTDLEVAGIQFGGDALVGAATGGIGTLPSMYVRAAGSSINEAEKQGADRETAIKYGLAIGGVEVATEKMFSVAKPLEKIYGKGVGDLLMTKVLGKLAKNRDGVVKQTFMSALGEGLEEMVAEGVEPTVANKIYADALAEDKRDEAYRSAIQNGATEAEAKEYADKVYNSIHQSTSFADILRAGSIGAAMGGLLGGGASVIEASNGARIKQQFGKDGLRDIANRAVNVDDVTASVRAQEVQKRLKEGMDISAGQANAIVQAVQQQEAKDVQTQRRYNASIGVEIRRNNYESPIISDDNGNPVAFGNVTTDKIKAIQSEARESLDRMRRSTDTQLSEAEASEVTEAYAAVMTGVATPLQVGMFTTAHPEARALFETMNPGIKLPKSNEQTREFLFGMSARNYVETAKQETEYRQDVIRGHLDEDMTIDYGSRGQEEFTKLMEDENIDPRMAAKGEAAGVFEDYYRAGAMGIPFEQILQNGNPVHNLLTYAQKKAAYESGFADLSIRNAIPKGSIVSMGQRVSETKTEAHRGKLTDREHLLTGKQRRMYQALAEKLNININIVSDEDVNGFYKDGEVYMSVNNDGRGLALVFGHEITHHIKAVSPENYEKLEKLVREKWEERGGIDEAIKEKQKQYKEKANQDLTEDEALEEIIADATYEMFGDVEFVKKICASDKTFAQSILYAIRRVLADIRECLANGRGFTPSQNEALLSHLDILSEFEDLWLQGLRDVAREGERIQSETVAESVTEEDINNSDSINDLIRLSLREEDMSQDLVERLNGEKKVKVYRAMQYIDGRLYPPMAAVVDGNLNGGTELNKWEQSEERPDLCIWKKGGKVVEPGTEGAKPYFRLWKRNSDKNGGKGDPVDARYNPYIHTSLSPLNDQFSSAYARPNMVVVEGEVPESELTSKYKAELAKDSVGETEWKSGKVAGELKKVGKPRRVILSRYFRPTRVLENDEVAQEIAKLLEGTDIKIPANVVTPGLLSALENKDVAIDRENVPASYKKDSEIRYSIGYTRDNTPVAIAEEDFLDGVPYKDRLRTAKNKMKEFRPGVPISGRLVGITEKTAGHYVNSDYSKFLRTTDTQAYRDKLSAISKTDEILYASTDYVNEDLLHPRRDDIVAFARGNVLLEVGERQYKAEIIIGIKQDDSLLYYDLENLSPTRFELKNKRYGLRWANESHTSMMTVPLDDNVPENDGFVKISPQRMDSLIEEYAIPNNDSSNYSKAWIATINPRDFLTLTVSDEVLETWELGTENEWGQKVRELDEEDLRRSRMMPRLTIDSRNSHSVIGHEGRHRMLALMRAGYAEVPVVVRDLSEANKTTKESMDEMDLWSEDHGNGPVNDTNEGLGARVDVYDVIPINEKNRAEIERIYGGDEGVRFSVRDNEKRNAGEKLTRAEFNRTYYAHKLNLRGKNLDQQIEEIKTNGFKASGGFNIMPADINDNGDTDVATSKYGGREGDTVLLVPKEYVKNDSVVNGYKPEDYEIVTVERDFQPYYELYDKAYDSAVKEQREALNNEGIEELDDGTTARYSVREDVTQAEESVQNLGSKANNTFEVPDEPENIRYSLFGHKNKQVKPVVTKADGVTGELFTTYDGTPVQSTVIDMTEEIMKILGKSDTDIKKVRTFMDSVADYMEGVAARYTFIGLEDVNNADITIRRDKDGNPDSVVLSAMVKNGEYPVNFDFSSVCKKREAVTNLINDLSKLDNGEFINSVSLSQENLWKLNEILMQEGFETACLGCFVETKRYNIEAWADSFVEKWNAAVEKINPNAEYFDFGSKEDLWYTNDIIEEFKEEKKKRKKKNKGKELSNEQTIGALLDTDVNLLKKLRRVDLMSPEGIKGLQKINPSVYGVLYGHYGSGTPKPVQPFTPYNSEIAMMGRKKNYTKANNDETVRKTNGELVEYLRGIGGLRTQSFSDFLIQNVFDYMQMISDMAARGFPGHAYSKEIAFAKIFGMTGLKINMSIMFDVDPDGIAPGLDKDGNYVVADKARQAREKENGREVFAFSFGWDDAIALQNDPRYDGNVGTIGVGLSDMHIRKMLEDPDIKFVIPYHKSGLPKPIAERSGLNIADDYTSTQNTLTITSITNKDGEDVTKKFGKKYFKNLYKEKGSWRAVFDQFHKDTEGLTVNTVKAEEGSGKFDIYTGDKGLDATQDPKATVENYFEWCVDNEYLPLFYQFADHENYYKLLYDFNVYKNDGTFAPQKAVENIYPEDLFDIIEGYMKEANEEKQKQAPKWDVVKERSQKMLMGETKYSIKETDSEGHKLSDAQREYFAESKVVDEEGRLIPVYHGTSEEFYEFEREKIGAHGSYEGAGFNFTPSDTRAKGYEGIGGGEGRLLEGYLNITNPIPDDRVTMSADDLAKIIEKIDPTGDDIIANYAHDTRDYGSPSFVKREAKATAKLMLDYHESDADIYSDLSASGANADAIISAFSDMGYDGVIHHYDDGKIQTLIAFDSNQFKNIDNTSPTESNDIRYSLPEDNPPTEDEVIDQANLDDEFSEWAYDSSPYAQEGKAVRVKSEAELRKQVEQLRLDKRLTHGRLLDTKPIKKDIENLLRTMATITQEAGNPVVGLEGKMSKQNQRIVDDTVKNAKHIYKLMKQGRDSDAVALAMTCADDIVSRIQIIDDANYDAYKKIKGYLKSTPMRISEEDSHDIPDFADFKKDNFGKVRIVKEGGIPVEEAYEELSEMFPGMFDEDITHPAEMLEAIVDARGSFEPYDVMLTSEEREQLLKDTTADLLDIIAEGQPYRTWADKKSEMYQTKVNMLRERYKEAMRDLREKERARADRRVQAEREKGEKRLAQEKERSARKVQEIKDKNKEQKAKQKDNKQRKEFWNRISENHKTLSDWLVKPTDDKHIPENYKLAIADLLMALDMQTERSKQLEAKTGHVAQKTFKFQQLLDAYEEIFTDKGAGIFEKDEQIIDMLKDSLIKHLEGKSVDALDTKTMGEIDILLKAIVGNVRNANKAFAAEKETTISEMAEKVRDDCKQVVKRSGTFNDRKRTIGRWLFETNKLLNISMKKPREFFEHLGGGMTDAYMEIRHGMDKHFDNMDELRTEFGKIFSDYNNKKKPGSAIEKWRDTSMMKSFDLESGETITLNPAQIMSLYCLNKREQAHKHMYEGAGIIASRVQGVSGKVVKLKNEVEGTQVSVTRADVDKIIATLSEEQLKIADQLMGLLNGMVQQWGNKTSMQMFNYEKFTEKNYFPIKSDDAYIASNFEAKGKQAERIRNFGFTKGTDVNASNPIVIADIFEVVADHCNKMSLYNALAAPISDFQRMYNTNFWDEEGKGRSSVQNELRVAFGTDVDNYISNLMADINNNTQVRPEETAALINKSLANYKKATIGLNLRVAVQQPTAIVRAFDIISPKYFVGMDKAHLIRNAKEMIEHCPIARWKSWGHNEVDMARDIDDIMMNRAWSRFDLITMGTYGALDIGTWGMIWSAVKKEVKATHKDVEVGSDEFWNLCNERASEVFDKTQVVDSVLHRSQVMRDKQIMIKLLTSFMAEPTTTFNMLQSDLVEARDLWAEGRKKEAMAKANRVIVVFTANAAAVSAAAAFIDWLRDKQPDDDDDDKEGWALWYANFLSNFVDNANVLMMIPFVKDVLQLKEGWGTSNMAFEGWESLMKSISEWEKFINGKSKKSNGELIRMTAEGIGLVTGIPVKSVLKDFFAFTDRFGISFASTQGTEEKIRIETEDGGILEVYPQKETITDKFFKLIGIKDNSDSDKFLNKFGLNLSEEEKKEKAMNDKIREISEKVEGLEGEERDKKLWETITRKKGDDEPGLTQYLEAGNTDAAEEMLKLFKECGGSEEYFNEKMMKIAKSSFKKTIGEHDKLIEQTKLYDYMLEHGMSEADISKVARDSDTRKEFQKAYALGEEEKAILLLSDLIDAGLTYEDYEWSCKNAYRTVNPSDYATGEFSWPTNGTITSGFGRRSSPTAGASSFHQAIDIGAPTGTPVNAADGGKVIYCGWYGGYGNRVVVDHGNGYKTCYSHLSGYQVKQGQVLRKGQQLGKVGSTGVSTGPHLDFQVEQNGQYVDPSKYLPK